MEIFIKNFNVSYLQERLKLLNCKHNNLQFLIVNYLTFVSEIKVGPGSPNDHHVSIVGGKCSTLFVLICYLHSLYLFNVKETFCTSFTKT